jgi:hypothetical protein
MPKQIASFRDIAFGINKAELTRDVARSHAFDELEATATTLARAAVAYLGDRQRAERWMCIKQRKLGGRCAYEALAEGDFDEVWDLIIGEQNDH